MKQINTRTFIRKLIREMKNGTAIEPSGLVSETVKPAREGGIGMIVDYKIDHCRKSYSSRVEWKLSFGESFFDQGYGDVS